MSLTPFTTWAQTHNLKFTHIAPTITASHGLGLTTTVPLAPSRADIAFCPRSLLLTRATARRFSPPLPTLPASVSTHAVLALGISQQLSSPSHPWHPWISTWPSPSDFQTTLPLLWRPKERGLLPPSTLLLAAAQEQKYTTDLRGVGAQESDAAFQYAWCVVNTRTLWFGKGEMCLAAGIDLFNHSDDPSCDVRLGTRGYHVTPRTRCEVGEEVTVSYGPHGNDFLLVEYGFLLERNRWDGVCLDSEFGRWREELEREGWWGGYVLSVEGGVCFRTQVAVRIVLGCAGWRGFAAGVNEGREEQGRVDEWVLAVLGELRNVGVRAGRKAEELEREGVRDTIMKRWGQVLEIVDCVEGRLRRNIDLETI